MGIIPVPRNVEGLSENEKSPLKLPSLRIGTVTVSQYSRTLFSDKPFNSTWILSGILCFRRQTRQAAHHVADIAKPVRNASQPQQRGPQEASRFGCGWTCWYTPKMIKMFFIGKMIGNHQIWYPIFRQTHFNPFHVFSCPNRWKALSSPRGTSIHLCDLLVRWTEITWRNIHDGTLGT